VPHPQFLEGAGLDLTPSVSIRSLNYIRGAASCAHVRKIDPFAPFRRFRLLSLLHYFVASLLRLSRIWFPPQSRR
jgi:hypothetical protein